MTRLADDMNEALRRLGVDNRSGYVITALYKFVDLADYRALQPRLRK